jgi:hypothetical protein
MFNGFQGKFGNMVIKQCNGKTIISALPCKSSNPPTQKQLMVQRRFTCAARYAKTVMADPEAHAALATRLQPGQTVYTLAMKDFYTANPSG